MRVSCICRIWMDLHILVFLVSFDPSECNRVTLVLHLLHTLISLIWDNLWDYLKVISAKGLNIAFTISVFYVFIRILTCSNTHDETWKIYPEISLLLLGPVFCYCFAFSHTFHICWVLLLKVPETATHVIFPELLLAYLLGYIGETNILSRVLQIIILQNIIIILNASEHCLKMDSKNILIYPEKQSFSNHVLFRQGIDYIEKWLFLDPPLNYAVE